MNLPQAAAQAEIAAAIFKAAQDFHQQGKTHEALQKYIEVLEIQADHFDALQLSGNILFQLGFKAEALNVYDLAIKARPGDAGIHIDRGCLLADLGRQEEAMACFGRALELKPDDAIAQFNRGNLLRASGRPEEAASSFQLVIALNPDFALAHNNLGSILKDLDRHDEALSCYQRALEITPDFFEVRLNLAIAYLQVGDFERGWEYYDARWQTQGSGKIEAEFERPLWLGDQSLDGKTILLHAEQGLGDTLQFCRYVQKVKELGAAVILCVHKPLIALLSHLQGVDVLIEKGSELPAHDYQCPLMSLPRAFRTRLDSIPSAASYIVTDKSKVPFWRKKIDAGLSLKVGLAWSGSPKNEEDQRRSIAFAEFSQMLPQAAACVVLQNQVRAADLDLLAARPEIRYFGDELDLSAAAVVCEQMDVIVTVDTSIAHLAGALGKPVFVLLPYSADWRWLKDRSDSPWYPSATLFRQHRLGDWSEVVRRVRLELEQLARLKNPAASSKA